VRMNGHKRSPGFKERLLVHGWSEEPPRRRRLEPLTPF
jgi:hypothetical protein